MRFVAMLATLALASALAGCPKKEDPPPGSTNPPSSASLSAAKTAAPPPVADWQEVKVKAAKLSVKIPKGASIAEDKAGADEAFAGSYFRVKMASGYDLYFGEQKGKDAVDIVAEKRRYRLDSEKKIELVYEADDAIVVNRVEDPPAGKYCEATACGRIAGRPICASHAGALRTGQEITKLTDVECLAVVRHRPVHHRPLIFSRSTSVTSCQKIERQGRIGRAYALRARGTRVASPKT